MRRFSFWLVAFVSGCHLIGGYGDFNVVERGDGGSTSVGGTQPGGSVPDGGGGTGGGGTGGGGAGPCMDPEDCPAPSEECMVAMCDAGVCGSEPADPDQDCSIGKCDGAGTCRCSSNSDCTGSPSCDQTDGAISDCICIDGTQCFNPYRWAVVVEPETSGSASLNTMSLLNSGDVLIGVQHKTNISVSSPHITETVLASSSGDDVFTVAKLNDSSSGEVAWSGRVKGYALPNVTGAAIGTSEKAFVTGTFQPTGCSTQCTQLVAVSGDGTETPVTPVVEVDHGFVATITETGTPEVGFIGQQTGGGAPAYGIQVDDVACSGDVCVVVGRYNQPFELFISDTETAPDPESNKHGFAIAYSDTLVPQWVVWFDPAANGLAEQSMDVTVTPDHAYVGLDFHGVLTVKDPLMDHTLDNTAGAGHGFVRLALGNGEVEHTTQLANAIQYAKGMAATTDIFTVSMSGQMGALFGSSLMSNGIFDCAIAFTDPMFMSPQVASIKAVSNNDVAICDGQASDGSNTFTSFFNFGDSDLVDANGMVVTTFSGNAGIIGWDPLFQQPRWSAEFVSSTPNSSATPPVARYANPGLGLAVGMDVGSNGGQTTVEFSPSMQLTVESCSSDYCAAAILRMGAIPPPLP